MGCAKLNRPELGVGTGEQVVGLGRKVQQHAGTALPKTIGSANSQRPGNHWQAEV